MRIVIVGAGEVGFRPKTTPTFPAREMDPDLCMLLGRLEISTVIILFVPQSWRK